MVHVDNCHAECHCLQAMIEKNDQTVPVADGRPFLAPNCYVKNILNLTIHLDENYVVHVLAYLLLEAQSATFPGANLL